MKTLIVFVLIVVSIIGSLIFATVEDERENNIDG